MIPITDIFHEGLSDYLSLEKLALTLRANPNLKEHTWDHTQRVTMYSRWLALNLFPDLVKDSIIAGLFHDVGRKKDGPDQVHGIYSAQIFSQNKGLIKPEDFDSIFYAIARHSLTSAPNGEIPILDNFQPPDYINRTLVAILWDADRLDLLRLPTFSQVDPRYLNLELSRQLANTDLHKGLYRY